MCTDDVNEARVGATFEPNTCERSLSLFQVITSRLINPPEVVSEPDWIYRQSCMPIDKIETVAVTDRVSLSLVKMFFIEHRPVLRCFNRPYDVSTRISTILELIFAIPA